MATTISSRRSRSSSRSSSSSRRSSSSSRSSSPDKNPPSHMPTISRTFKILYNDAYFRFSLTFSASEEPFDKLKEALQKRGCRLLLEDFYFFWLDYEQSIVYGAGRVRPKTLKKYLNENLIVRLLLVIPNEKGSTSNNAAPTRRRYRSHNKKLGL